ncbi:MAG: hypothetical protein Q9186_002613 [Xanthomendoza sp. 1 TL-2023]
MLIGSIIFMSSDSGSAINFRAFEDGFAAYAASKAALNQALRHMAAELQRKGSPTTILAMHPGEVATDLANVTLDWEVEGILSVEESVSAMILVIETKTIQDSGKFYTWEGKSDLKDARVGVPPVSTADHDDSSHGRGPALLASYARTGSTQDICMESSVIDPKSGFFIGSADKSFTTDASAIMPTRTAVCEHTDPLQRDLLLAPKLADTAFDLDNRADIKGVQIDLAFRGDAYMCVILWHGHSIQSDDPMVADRGIDARGGMICVLPTKYLDWKATAVIQRHNDTVRVDVEGHDDADEADPLYWMIGMKVYVLT